MDRLTEGQQVVREQIMDERHGIALGKFQMNTSREMNSIMHDTQQLALVVKLHSEYTECTRFSFWGFWGCRDAGIGKRERQS